MSTAPVSGTVSLADTLSTLKNLVTAVNALIQQCLNVEGAQTIEAIAADTLVKPTAGRVARISVTTAGSATGLVYDSNNVSTTTRPLYVIPNTVGVYVVNMPVSYGVFVSPGSGQVVAVSFS